MGSSIDDTLEGLSLTPLPDLLSLPPLLYSGPSANVCCYSSLADVGVLSIFPDIELDLSDTLNLLRIIPRPFARYLPEEIFLGDQKLIKALSPWKPTDKTPSLFIQQVDTEIRDMSGNCWLNTPYLESIRNFFSRSATLVAAGNFGKVYRIGLKDTDLGIIVKVIFDRLHLERVHICIDKLGTLKDPRSIQRHKFWEVDGVDLYKIKLGYAMRERNEIGRPFNWIHNLLDWIILMGKNNPYLTNFEI
jgi:hypothetical protein